MTDHPKVSGPGLIWRARKSGWEARWQARTDLVRRGYPVKSVRVWAGSEPSEVDAAYITDQCRRLQDEMLVWGRGGLPVVGAFNGTLAGLIEAYQRDPDSSFRKLRHQTRMNHAAILRRLQQEHGYVEIRDIKVRLVLGWHAAWSADGKTAMAHAIVSQLRTAIRFGSAFLEDPECQRVKAVLSDMRFAMPRPRTARLTAEQATKLRRTAHAMEHHSIALAQALQFELMLRQKDVIGEWVPIAEPGASEVTAGGRKWLRGLRWSEIDGNLILRHVTSKRGKEIEVDLRLAPMVMEELGHLGFDLPASGPVVVNEFNNLPFTAHEFRRKWRLVADKAGIPKSVRNMDSRAGAISEATDAGAELEHVRHAATHSDIAMTQRYSRAGAEKTAKVMRLRAESRTKNRDD